MPANKTKRKQLYHTRTALRPYQHKHVHTPTHTKRKRKKQQLQLLYKKFINIFLWDGISISTDGSLGKGSEHTQCPGLNPWAQDWRNAAAPSSV